jgi:biotin carboxylase
VKRLLLLVPSTTYRATDFVAAALRLDVELLVGSERRQALEKIAGGTVTLNFRNADKGVYQILKLAKAQPIDAIVAVDDEAVVLAARAADALLLPHNNPDSVATTRNKHQFRQCMDEAGLPAPTYWLTRIDEDPQTIAAEVDYPCVLKPVALSASQGVIRADNPAQFVTAFERIQCILRNSPTRRDGAEGDEAARQILVESYIPGVEVALEGLLVRGQLNVLALFDKPDPLEGPFFEETIYVTPSRLTKSQQQAISETTQAAVMAIGLEEGPVHAELRLTDDGPVVIELAARSIGGLCARILEFGAGIGLEELILRHALGLPIENMDRERSAGGVMMLPIPRKGTLRAVSGKGAALSVEGVKDLTITVPIGQDVVPLPEGRQYLGFLFAKAETPAGAEAALRSAHRHLVFDID